jgi:hypothetical protein
VFHLVDVARRRLVIIIENADLHIFGRTIVSVQRLNHLLLLHSVTESMRLFLIPAACIGRKQIIYIY